MAVMKIIAIGGFLGAGKTTLLLRLARALRESGVERLAIIENEAGKVGIDDALVREAGLNVKEIFGGCVCCSMGPNLLTTLKELERGYEPDVVMVEASGVASPDMIPRVLEGYDRPLGVRLVVVFDAERFEAISHVAGPMVESSATIADALVLNKVDVVDRAKVLDMVDRLHQLRGGAAVVPMAADSGEGFERLLEALDANAAPAERDEDEGEHARGHGPGDRGEAHDRRRGDDHAAGPRRGHGHEHEHEHGGDPVAEARWFAIGGAASSGGGGEGGGGAVDGAAAARATRDAVRRITEAIDAEPGAVVGHVKALLTGDGGGGRAAVRQTSAVRGPTVDGDLAETLAGATLVGNALAYGTAGERPGAVVDEAVGGLGEAIGAAVEPGR